MKIFGGKFIRQNCKLQTNYADTNHKNIKIVNEILMVIVVINDIMNDYNNHESKLSDNSNNSCIHNNGIQ